MTKEKLDLDIYTKSGKLRKRKRKKSRNYFNEDTQQAILDFVSSSDKEQREKIYNERIAFSFYKLAENIIHTFKFYYTELDNVEELKHEVVAFLLQKIHLFKPDKGRAYSYFGTIAKRYLIIYNEECYKKQKAKANLDEVDSNQNIFIQLANSDSEMDLLYFLRLFIEYLETNIPNLFLKDMERSTAYAVLELFKKRDQVDIMNKQAFYLYVKEQTGNTAPQITKTVKQIKVIYKKLQDEYYLTGDVKI